MVLALYVGFSRLNHLRFLEREPMLIGILKILRLAAAVHLLAVSGFAASERGRADSPGSASVAAARMGSRPCRSEDEHAGYRYHGA